MQQGVDSFIHIYSLSTLLISICFY